MLGWWQTTTDSPGSSTLVSVLVALCVSASLTLWVRFGWRASEGQPILPYEPRRPVPWTIGGLFALFLVFLCASQWFAWLYLEPSPTRPYAFDGPPAVPNTVSGEPVITSVELFVFLATQLCVLLAALVGFRHFYQATPEDWGLVATRIGHDFAIAVVAAVAFLPPVYAIQALVHQFNDTPHTLIRALTESDDPWLRPLAFAAAGIWAPIWEELFFRVVLQGWLERVLLHRSPPLLEGTEVQELAPAPDAADEYAPAVAPLRGGWLPIAISSALFAAMHFNFQSPNLDFIPLFFFACGLGFLYQRTHRAIPSILLHMILNVCTLIMLALSLPSS